MNWKTRKRYTEAVSEDKQICFMIHHNLRNHNGMCYVKAHLEGGAEHQLPFKNFKTPEDAQARIERYEVERAERNARYAQEEPIRF